MSDTPDEFYIAPNDGFVNPWSRPLISDPFDERAVEYIRHDIHEAAITKAHAEGREAGVREAAGQAKYLSTTGGPDWAESTSWNSASDQCHKNILDLLDAMPDGPLTLDPQPVDRKALIEAANAAEGRGLCAEAEARLSDAVKYHRQSASIWRDLAGHKIGVSE